MCPQDAGSDHKWGHWFTYRSPSDDNNVTPARFHADLAPDTSELSPEERCPTAFTTKDGHPFVLFSDQNPKTVLRQFQWMAEYKIDVAALQRFIVAIAPGRPAALRQGLDTVLHNALDAADATGRGFYVMYDIAGAARPAGRFASSEVSLSVSRVPVASTPMVPSVVVKPSSSTICWKVGSSARNRPTSARRSQGAFGVARKLHLGSKGLRTARIPAARAARSTGRSTAGNICKCLCVSTCVSATPFDRSNPICAATSASIWEE